MSESLDVTELLAAWQGGSREALDAMMPIVMGELKRIAGSYLAREANAVTLQTTALVHELYLRLVGDFHPSSDDRRRFFGAAAKVMRRILIDRARERLAEKRGAGVRPESLDEDRLVNRAAASGMSFAAPATEALAVDQALDALELHDPRLAELVELRFFAGCSVEESAALLGMSERTVKRDWRKARALLADWLGAGG